MRREWMKPGCLVVLLLVACGSPGSAGDGGTQPPLTLELIKPTEGASYGSVVYRLTRQQQAGANVLLAKKSAPGAVVAQAPWCGQSQDNTCTGSLAPVTAGDEDYEVWAELITGESSSPAYTTPRVTVRLNTLPVVAAKLMESPSRLTFVITGSNKLDPATLPFARMTGRFQVLPWIRDFDNSELGLETIDVPVTTTLSGNVLSVAGDFSGPISLSLDLSKVTNQYGTGIKTRLELYRPFWAESLPLGKDNYPGGQGPRLQVLPDGTVYLLHRSPAAGGNTGVDVSVRVSDGTRMTETASFNAPNIDVFYSAGLRVDHQGVPFIFQGSGTAQLFRWNGSALVALPDLPYPPPRFPGNNVFSAQLAFDGTNAPVVLTQRLNGTLNVDAFAYRYDGAGWQKIFERFDLSDGQRSYVLFEKGNGLFLHLTKATADTAAGDVLEKFAGGGFVVVPSATALAQSLSALPVRYSYEELVADPDGTLHLLVSHSDGGDVSSTGLTVLKFDGTGWTVAAQGKFFQQAWLDPLKTPVALYLREFDVRAFLRSPDGAYTVITREQVSIGSGLDRFFNLGAYQFRIGRWGPLKGARSPSLASEELVGRHVVNGAAYDVNGALWLTQLKAPALPDPLNRFDLQFVRIAP